MSIDINGELYRSPVSKSEIYSNEEHTQQIEATVKNNYQAFPTTHISPHRITDDKQLYNHLSKLLSSCRSEQYVPEYLLDNLDYMLCLQEESVILQERIDRKHQREFTTSYLNADAFAKAIQCIIILCEQFECSIATATSSCRIFALFLQINPEGHQTKNIEALCTACFFVACKYHEIYPMNMQELLNYCAAETTADILHHFQELLIQHIIIRQNILSFDCEDKYLYIFCVFLKEKMSEEAKHKCLRICCFIIESGLNNYRLQTHKASHKAATVIQMYYRYWENQKQPLSILRRISLLNDDLYEKLQQMYLTSLTFNHRNHFRATSRRYFDIHPDIRYFCLIQIINLGHYYFNLNNMLSKFVYRTAQFNFQKYWGIKNSQNLFRILPYKIVSSFATSIKQTENSQNFSYEFFQGKKEFGRAEIQDYILNYPFRPPVFLTQQQAKTRQVSSDQYLNYLVLCLRTLHRSNKNTLQVFSVIYEALFPSDSSDKYRPPKNIVRDVKNIYQKYNQPLIPKLLQQLSDSTTPALRKKQIWIMLYQFFSDNSFAQLAEKIPKPVLSPQTVFEVAIYSLITATINGQLSGQSQKDLQEALSLSANKQEQYSIARLILTDFNINRLFKPMHGQIINIISQNIKGVPEFQLRAIVSRSLELQRNDLKQMYLKNLVAEVFQRRDVPQYSAKLYKKIIKYFIFTKTSLEDLVKQIIEDERIVCPTKSFYEEEPEITPKILILFLFKWSNQMQNSFKFHEILNKVVMETFRHIFASQKLSTVTLSVFLEYFGRFIRSLSVPVINRIESKDFFQVIERFQSDVSVVGNTLIILLRGLFQDSPKLQMNLQIRRKLIKNYYQKLLKLSNINNYNTLEITSENFMQLLLCTTKMVVTKSLQDQDIPNLFSYRNMNTESLTQSDLHNYLFLLGRIPIAADKKCDAIDYLLSKLFFILKLGNPDLKIIMTITKALAKIGYARVKSIYSYLEIALCKAWVLTLKKKLKPSITDLEIVKASITDRGYGSRNLKQFLVNTINNYVDLEKNLKKLESQNFTYERFLQEKNSIRKQKVK